MPKIAYIDKRFNRSSQLLITQANDICAEFAAQGYDLTLRQLYYQFVARDIIKNKQTEYKRLGSVINDARLAGRMDWNYLVDRTRNLRDLAHWGSPESVIDAAASGYRTERWRNQPTRVEVWVEKDALTGVIGRTASRLDVPWFSCRGYTSQSELWGAAQRHLRHQDRGQDVVVIHLGDHDPSGVDMTRDVMDRFALFGTDTKVQRIALNMDQVRQYDPPPNPAKLTDSRAEGYIAKHGPSSWELDALSPDVLDGLITSAVLAYRDETQWDIDTATMNRERELLQNVATDWADVVDFIENRDLG